MAELTEGAPLPCGHCYVEDGRAIHPHPECPETTEEN